MTEQKIIIRPEAEADIRDAYYYEECSKGLGSNLLLSLDASFSLIKRNPEIFQKVYKNIHRGLIYKEKRIQDPGFRIQYKKIILDSKSWILNPSILYGQQMLDFE